ncbi:10467_t:CDS:1, partial [Ambispora leptoticha]
IHTIARVITYFKLQMQFKVSIKQIRIDYNQFYYPEAENFLIKHLNISIPTQYDDSLFLQNTTTPNSQEEGKETQNNTTLTSSKESEKISNTTSSTSQDETKEHPF